MRRPRQRPRHDRPRRRRDRRGARRPGNPLGWTMSFVDSRNGPKAERGLADHNRGGSRGSMRSIHGRTHDSKRRVFGGSPIAVRWEPPKGAVVYCAAQAAATFVYRLPSASSFALSTIPKPVDGRVVFDLVFFGFFASRLPRCCSLAMALGLQKCKARPFGTGLGASPWEREGRALRPMHLDLAQLSFPSKPSGSASRVWAAVVLGEELQPGGSESGASAPRAAFRLTSERQSVSIRLKRQEPTMGVTAPVIVAALAILACGIGVCGVAHRLLSRGGNTDAHCRVRAGQRNRLSRIAPLLFSALFCGLVMAVAFAYLTPH